MDCADERPGCTACFLTVELCSGRIGNDEIGTSFRVPRVKSRNKIIPASGDALQVSKKGDASLTNIHG